MAERAKPGSHIRKGARRIQGNRQGCGDPIPSKAKVSKEAQPLTSWWLAISPDYHICKNQKESRELPSWKPHCSQECHSLSLCDHCLLEVILQPGVSFPGVPENCCECHKPRVYFSSNPRGPPGWLKAVRGSANRAGGSTGAWTLEDDGEGGWGGWPEGREGPRNQDVAFTPSVVIRCLHPNAAAKRREPT